MGEVFFTKVTMCSSFCEIARSQTYLDSGLKNVPRHVAIIPDGNRRWALKRGLPSHAGHWQGASKLEEILQEAILLGIKFLTVYSFSTENWNRSPEEVSNLMKLFETYLRKMKDRMVRDGVKLLSIGDLTPFPDSVKHAFLEVKAATQHCEKLTLVLALNYGGRDDLRRAVLKIMDHYKDGSLSKENLTEDVMGSYLDTADFGDPELLIRAGGEKRISNFLIWQISYSEVFISDLLWPDFTANEFRKAIVEYQSRHRRLGE